MSKVAADAKIAANAKGTVGWCLEGVENGLDAAGIKEPRLASAFQLADVLAKDPRFTEIHIANDQLPNLPPGVVTVWSAGSPSAAGHISVSIGGGNEASDHLQHQITRFTTQRSFVPNS